MNLNSNPEFPNDKDIKASIYQCVQSVCHVTEQLANMVSVLNEKTSKHQSKCKFVMGSSDSFDSSNSPIPSDSFVSAIESTSSNSSNCNDLYQLKCQNSLNKCNGTIMVSNLDGIDKVKPVHILNRQEISMDSSEDNPSNNQQCLYEIDNSDAQLQQQNIDNNRSSLPIKVISVEERPTTYSHSQKLPFHFIASKDSDVQAEPYTTIPSSSLISTHGYSRNNTLNDYFLHDTQLKSTNLFEIVNTKKNETKTNGYNSATITRNNLKTIHENTDDNQKDDQIKSKNNVESMVTMPGFTVDQFLEKIYDSYQWTETSNLDDEIVKSLPSMSAYSSQILDINDICNENTNLQSLIETKTNTNAYITEFDQQSNDDTVTSLDSNLNTQMMDNIDSESEYVVIIPNTVETDNINCNISNNHNYLGIENYNDLDNFLDVYVQQKTDNDLHTSINNHNNAFYSSTNVSNNCKSDNQLSSELSNPEIINVKQTDNVEKITNKNDKLIDNKQNEQTYAVDEISCYTYKKNLIVKKKSKSKRKIEIITIKSQKVKNSNKNEITKNNVQSVECNVPNCDNIEVSVKLQNESPTGNFENRGKVNPKSLISYEDFVRGSIN